MSAFDATITVHEPHAEHARALALRLQGHSAGDLGALGRAACWLAARQPEPALAPISQPALAVFGHDSTAEVACSTSPSARRMGLRTSFTELGAEAGTHKDISAALHAGAQAAHSLIDSGTDLAIAAEAAGARTEESILAAYALVGRLRGIEPVKLVGPGYALTATQWAQRVAQVREAMYTSRSLTAAQDLLEALGTDVVAALTGFIITCAQRRTPVVVDSTLGSVAVLVAESMCPGASSWVLHANLGSDTCQGTALEALGVKDSQPYVNVSMNAEAGLAAVIFVELLAGAVEMICEA